MAFLKLVQYKTRTDEGSRKKFLVFNLGLFIVYIPANRKRIIVKL